MFEYIHSSFPERKLSTEPIFSEMMNTFTLHFPIENVLQSQSSLKWWIHSLFISRSKTFSRANLLLNYEYIHSSLPDWKCSPEPIFSEMMNTLTLHFLIENVLQSQSSLKWWIHSLFISRSKTRWLWIHSLFISRSQTFSRVPNLLWNEVFSETHGRLCTVRSTGLRLSGSPWIFFVLELIVV